MTLKKTNMQKRIYWTKEGQGNAFILIGYCPDTLEYFQAMFDEARKTFASLTEADVTCGKVTKSSSVKGFTLITFPIPDQLTPEQIQKLENRYDEDRNDTWTDRFVGWRDYETPIDFNY